MPPELALARSARATLSPAWRVALARLTLAWALLIAAFAPDWARMAGQWWNSSTYTHILLVPPIIAWLVWLRRVELAKLEPQGWAPGMLAVAGAALVWLLGASAGLDLLRQTGAVALLPASAVLLLGPRAAAGLAFPLAYFAFLVPFGDELVPALQLVTARLAIALTHLSGVPAAIEGVFIQTPAGLFEVAEACSGVKFLIAMVAFGALAANVCFVSWRRRAAFMALAIFAPVLANGVRAWGTIYLAQSLGIEAAGGFDHIVYGWIFFAAVIAAVLVVSWRFFDRASDDPMIDAPAITASPVLTRLAARRIAPAATFALLLVAVGTAKAWAVASDRLTAPVPRQLFLPQVPGWQRADYTPRVWWEPRANGADHRLLGRYVDGSGRAVDVFFAFYSAQREGGEAGGFGEGAAPAGGAWTWEGVGPTFAEAHGDVLRTRGNLHRVAVTYYRTGTLISGSNTRLKLANIANRLLLRERPTLMLIVSAEDAPGAPAQAAIRAFEGSAGPVAEWMDRVATLR